MAASRQTRRRDRGAAGGARRPCSSCGVLTALAELREAHVGSRLVPHADVVMWLCRPCAREASLLVGWGD